MWIINHFANSNSYFRNVNSCWDDFCFCVQVPYTVQHSIKPIQPRHWPQRTQYILISLAIFLSVFIPLLKSNLASYSFRNKLISGWQNCVMRMGVSGLIERAIRADQWADDCGPSAPQWETPWGGFGFDMDAILSSSLWGGHIQCGVTKEWCNPESS